MSRHHPRVEPSGQLPGYIPLTDRTPMGYARRDEAQTALRLDGEIAELQRLAAALSADHDADRIVDDLQRIIALAANALADAGRLRGIRETAANFEETNP